MRRCAVAVLLVTLGAAGCGTEEVPPDAVAGAQASARPRDPEPTSTTVFKTPAAPGDPQVLDDGWCSKDLVDYMVLRSTSSSFKRGFGRPTVIAGLDVGCAGVAPEVSLQGYIDTYAFVRRSPGVMRTIRQRILALGFTGGPNSFINPAGDPEGFVSILGDEDDSAGQVFVDHDTWVVVQFYMPG